MPQKNAFEEDVNVNQEQRVHKERCGRWSSGMPKLFRVCYSER